MSSMSLYIVNFLQGLRKCLIMIGLRYSISATTEGSAVYIIYVGEQEIHRVLTCHCANYTVWPGPLLIVLCSAFAAKSLDTLALELSLVLAHPFVCRIIIGMPIRKE